MNYNDIRTTHLFEQDDLFEAVGDLKTQITRLRRMFGADAKAYFRANWRSVEEVLGQPTQWIRDFTSQYPSVDSQLLSAVLMNMREDDSLRDKENYLRSGYESRGFCGTNSAVVWVRDNDKRQEYLHLFSKNDAALGSLLGYMRHCRLVS